MIRTWAFFSLLALCSQSALARKFDVQLFKPEPNQGTGTFLGTPGSVLQPGEWAASVFFNYANDPLVLYGADGERLASLVGSQWGLDLLAAVGLHERLELGLDVPFVLAQGGDAVGFAPSAPNAGFGIGDLRVQPKVLLLGQRDDDGPSGLAVSAAAVAYVPSGSRKQFQGEQGFRLQGKVIAEYRIPHLALLVGNVGYMIRPEAQVANANVNDMITWTLGGALQITDEFQAVTDFNGELSILADHIGQAELPLEWLMGGKYLATKNLAVSAGFGLGLACGVGAPDYRLFAGVGWVNLYEGPQDADADGLLDKDDACPVEAEDADNFEDQDGCPDPDNDKDQVLDAQDGAPNDPEDADGYQDADGVPEPDNDQDGVLDAQDKCPIEAEDADQFEDDDGCAELDNDKDDVLDTQDGAPNDPEDKDGFKDDDGVPDPDHDNDGVLDADDKCPDKLETLNGFEDQDGCPDSGGKVLLTCEKIEIKEKIYFDTGSAKIQSRSFALLDQLTAVVKQASQIAKLRIEGHTDDRGDDASNKKLSQLRADSVRDYLVQHGLDAARLESVGYGETAPIASNRSARGREINRRVEFIVAERTGECSEKR